MQAQLLRGASVPTASARAPAAPPRSAGLSERGGDAPLGRVPSAVSLQTVQQLRTPPQAGPTLRQPPASSLGPPEAHPTRPALDAHEATLFAAQRFLHPTAQGQQQVWFADRFEALCQQQGMPPGEALTVLHTLHRVHELTSAQRRALSPSARTGALTIMLRMYGQDNVRPIAEQLAQARALHWSRLIQFAGEAALMPLANLVVTDSTAVAATQWCALVAVKQATEAKAAVSLLAKLKCYGLASAAALGATLSAGCAGVMGYYALRQAYLAITVFRDVWDNGTSRDAYLLHNVYVRESRLRHDRALRQAMEAWTPPSHRFAYWVREQWARPEAPEAVAPAPIAL